MNPLNANPATLGARLQVAAGKWAIVAVLLVSCVGGGYVWGSRAAATKCAARNGNAAAKVETREDKRDLNIDAIGTAVSTAVSTAMAQNKGGSDESAERIRTVVVPADCRVVDPGIVRELRAASDDVNAALGVRLRPGATGAAASGSADEP